MAMQQIRKVRVRIISPVYLHEHHKDFPDKRHAQKGEIHSVPEAFARDLIMSNKAVEHKGEEENAAKKKEGK